MIGQSIERIKRDEEMDEEERKSCLDSYIEDCKLLMKSIQVITESIERGKGEIEERREKENKELLHAAEDNNTKKVKSLLERGIADVDWQNVEEVDEGFTALHVASRTGYLEIFKLLIDAGAKVDFQDNLGYTALHVASGKGYLEICKLLINAGAEVDLQDYYGSTALHVASRFGYLEICKLLINAGAEVDLQDYEDVTPLIVSSKIGHLELCKLLIKAKGKVDIQCKDGMTSLLWACLKGHQEIAFFLLAEGAAYTFKDDDGETAGDYAIAEHGWNWNAMIDEANLSFFDHVFDCMVNADYSPIVEKKEGRKRKRKRGEEEEGKEVKELPFILRFMKRVYFSDIMMSKNVFPKLSFNPGAEAGEGIQEF